MRNTIWITFVCCLALSACSRSRSVTVVDSQTATKAEIRWQALGTRTVHGRADRDVIPVTAREGRFRKLRIEVTGSALEMHNVVVRFGDGSRYSPDTRLVFRKGGTSRVIDLPGEARVIREISFRYSNIRGGGRARVHVSGR